MKRALKIVGVACLFYVLIAWATFQGRHPKANQMTFYTYFPTMITFGTAEELR
jgi:hypothetical protein